MFTNTDQKHFDVIEITNEMPYNRIGGVGSVIENLISGFQNIDVNVLWFVLDHNYRPFEIENILALSPSVVFGTYEDLSKFKAPVVHLHSYNYNPKLLDYISKKNSIFTVHSLLSYEETSNDVELPHAVQWQETLIRHSNKVVLVSEAEKKYYHRLNYHHLNANVSVIYNGLREPVASFRQRLKKKIGFCGRLVPRKHPEYAQKILNERSFENIDTLIAGKTFSNYARNLLREENLELRVKYLGWCGGDRMVEFYNQIDLLAVPSIYEPFGMTALEAAVRGIPIVCTRIDGLVEILGEYAFYCADYTYESFHEAMCRWLDADDEYICNITEGALKRYHKYFTDTTMASEYQKQFNSFK